jgi:hypothetical protein
VGGGAAASRLLHRKRGLGRIPLESSICQTKSCGVFSTVLVVVLSAPTMVVMVERILR